MDEKLYAQSDDKQVQPSVCGTEIFTDRSGVRTVRLVRPLRILVGEISGVIVQLIQGVPKIRVAGAEERAFAYWEKKYSRQQTLRRRIQRIEDSINVFNAALPTLTSVSLTRQSPEPSTTMTRLWRT